MTEIPTPADQMPDASPAGGILAVQPNDPLQTCRVCRYEFRASAKLAGKKIPCSHCGTQVEITLGGPAANDPLIGKRIGNCRLTYRLGAGGIGLVYAGEQLSVGRKIAIKMLGAKAGANDVLVQRFQRESKLAAQINHPNVVHVYDCGYDRGVHFQLMELVDGGTLANLVETQVRLPWREAADLALQITRALEYIHGQDIIHRDIKPANILITVENGHRIAKLADLGLAKQLDSEQAQLGLTLEGKPLGSPSFMPPEQVRNAKDATRASDLYGVGATFYAALTGYRPFDGKTSYEVMANVLTKEVVPPKTLVPDLPPALNDLIMRCLSKDASKRPQKAEELARDLERLLSDHGGPGPVKAPTPTSAAWKRPDSVGMSETTPPTIPNRDAADARRTTVNATQTPSASWKRPTTEGGVDTSPPAPVPRTTPAAAPAATPQPGKTGVSPVAIGVLIGLGVAIVALLVVLILK
jgi:eukaryotic-like serine/threonine-protein kinase